jgi:DNA polymerase IV
MDAFYASVEQRDDPSLRGRPVVVGGAGGSRGGRGRVLRGAPVRDPQRDADGAGPPPVPGPRRRRQPLRPLPRGVPPGDGDPVDVTPLVEPLSLDEAFLDVAGAVRLFGEPPEIGSGSGARSATSSTCPARSGWARPSRSPSCSRQGQARRAAALAGRRGGRPPAAAAVADLWGAGPKTVERLEATGFRTVGQLADTDLRRCSGIVGDALGSQLHRLARGEDPRTVTPHEPARSISAEETFDEDVDDPRSCAARSCGSARRSGRLRGGGARRPDDHAEGPVRVVRDRHPLGDPAPPTDRTHDLVVVATGLLDGLRLERARSGCSASGCPTSATGTGPGSSRSSPTSRRRGALPPPTRGGRTSTGSRTGSRNASGSRGVVRGAARRRGGSGPRRHRPARTASSRPTRKPRRGRGLRPGHTHRQEGDPTGLRRRRSR